MKTLKDYECDLSSPAVGCCCGLDWRKHLRIFWQRCVGLTAATSVGFVQYGLVKQFYDLGQWWTAAMAVVVAAGVWYQSQIIIATLKDCDSPFC